jgi:hypothetical protein
MHKDSCPNGENRGCKWMGCSEVIPSGRYLPDVGDVTVCGECGIDFPGSDDILQRQNILLSHMRTECKQFKVECPMGSCCYTGHFGTLPSHFEAGISRGLGQAFQLDEQDYLQVGECESMELPCPAGRDCRQKDQVATNGKCCDQQARCEAVGAHVPLYSVNNWVSHLKGCVKLRCPFSNGRCKVSRVNGEGWAGFYSDLEQHMMECPYLKIPCVYCGQELGRKAMFSHVLCECDSVETGCPRPDCDLAGLKLRHVFTHLGCGDKDLEIPPCMYDSLLLLLARTILFAYLIDACLFC